MSLIQVLGGNTSGDSIGAIATELAQNSESTSLLFLSPSIDRSELANVIRALPHPERIFGCTTAGEITTHGYREGSICGLSFPLQEFPICPNFIPDVRNFDAIKAEEIATNVRTFRQRELISLPQGKAFGVLLIDGMSVTEEAITGHLASIFPDIPIVGGSAGDGLSFRETFLLANGAFSAHSALFLVFFTERPFECFQTQHFTPSSDRIVITRANPAKRLVYEINGEPAAQEYARILGVTETQLSHAVFAVHPLCARIGGEYYVRSVQRLNPDHSLAFYCAIDEGTVLTPSRPLDIVAITDQALEAHTRSLGTIQATLAFECILRRLEVIDHDLHAAMAEVYRKRKVTGFHTYGEQLNSLHINQTLTAISFG